MYPLHSLHHALSSLQLVVNIVTLRFHLRRFVIIFIFCTLGRHDRQGCDGQLVHWHERNNYRQPPTTNHAVTCTHKREMTPTGDPLTQQQPGLRSWLERHAMIIIIIMWMGGKTTLSPHVLRRRRKKELPQPAERTGIPCSNVISSNMMEMTWNISIRQWQ